MPGGDGRELAHSAGKFLAAIMPGFQLSGLTAPISCSSPPSSRAAAPRDVPCFVIMGNTMPPRDPDEDEEAEDEEEDDEGDRAN
jgi:hypothetical protein